MLLQSMTAILDRDLGTLRREVEAYPDERELWQEMPSISNVTGTLVLHLAGNLQHYLGARLGRTGYVQDRRAEFTRQDVPRSELLRQIEAARATVKAALSDSAQPDVMATYPEAIGSSKVATDDYLIHLTTHFTYHLGQIDYHRRVMTGSTFGVDTIRPSELSSALPVEQ